MIMITRWDSIFGREDMYLLDRDGRRNAHVVDEHWTGRRALS
jgi:hypothetical protein